MNLIHHHPPSTAARTRRRSPPKADYPGLEQSTSIYRQPRVADIYYVSTFYGLHSHSNRYVGPATISLSGDMTDPLPLLRTE